MSTRSKQLVKQSGINQHAPFYFGIVQPYDECPLWIQQSVGKIVFNFHKP